MGKGEMHRRRMSRHMGRLVMGAGLAALAIPGRLLAATEGDGWEPVTLEAVEAPLLFKLVDGRSLRLAGIAAPAVLADGRAPSTIDGLMTRLQSLVGQAGLFARPLGIDRYGRLLALLRLAEGSLLQTELLAAGSVILWQGGLDLLDLEPLRQAEAQARTARLGLWSPALGLVEPAGAVRLPPSRLAVVEGRVQAVGSNASWIYLNFGADRNRDFTCRVNARDKRRFSKAGLPLDKLAGHSLRVRGWVFAQGGVMIEADDPSQLELL
ncbi:nuclease homologue [Arboricoccus pini]|uniref:Nuclease homologue n=1 Tax=Arboricoccus pini TaxID=1963835 RepID=A0A212QWB1_9PROT|nr:thermonuclease family protein [Arboricoccus pini]SNB63994.1 nuclease homologue [Arboricoccus pini]